MLNLAADVLKHVPEIIDYDATAKLVADDMNPLNVVLLQEVRIIAAHCRSALHLANNQEMYTHSLYISCEWYTLLDSFFELLSLATQTIYTAVYNQQSGSSVLLPGDGILSCQHFNSALETSISMCSDQFE